MLATASAQVCVPLGHSSLYFTIATIYDKLQRIELYHDLGHSRPTLPNIALNALYVACFFCG